MRKGQLKLIEKAKKYGFKNAQYLEDESLTIHQLNRLYRTISIIDIEVSKELLFTLNSCKLLSWRWEITPECEKYKNDKIGLLRYISGAAGWEYIKDPDDTFYFLSKVHDLTDETRVKAFIDILDEYFYDTWDNGYRLFHWWDVEKLAEVFNKTKEIPILTGKKKDDVLNECLFRANPVYELYKKWVKKHKTKWEFDGKVLDVFNSGSYAINVCSNNYTVKMYRGKGIGIEYTAYSMIKNEIFPFKDEVVRTEHGDYLHPSKQKEQIILLSYLDGIYEVYKNRTIPLTLKKAKKYSKLNKELKNFISEYLKSKEEYIARDIKDLPAIPKTINDVLQYSNVREMMNTYKEGEKINWNRCNIEAGYNVLKCLSKVTNPNILIDMLYKNEIPKIDMLGSAKKIPELLLTEIIYKHTGVNKYIALDYVRMCLRDKEKINLRYSRQRIEREHDRLGNWYKQAVKVKVPKNSKFKELPKELEWIKTSKRLKQEAERMHHCVASYDTLINRDERAICHIDKFNLPWTIEISKNDNKFKIVQIQTIANKPVDKTEIVEYVNSILNKQA